MIVQKVAIYPEFRSPSFDIYIFFKPNNTYIQQVKNDAILQNIC